MPALSASAPGKIILFGEHAVVYGRPAIALPVTQLKARAMVTPSPLGAPGAIHIAAPGIDLASPLEALSADHPIAAAIAGVCRELKITKPPACKLRITSEIPIEAGLGSGAAVSVAIIRVFSAFLGHSLAEDRISALAFEVEKIHHGTPSGIDNTVITYEQPILFIKDQSIERLRPSRSFHFVIGDTGIPSPTVKTVGDVRTGWESNRNEYDTMFDAIGKLTLHARAAFEKNNLRELGALMDKNQQWLEKMGVSSPALESLIDTARGAGSLGAKLSGGGRGGNMIALVHKDQSLKISKALETAGAVKTYRTILSCQVD
jgi:mevalonate kinase